MSRTRRTRPSPGAVGTGVPGELDSVEIVAAVCKLFCEGMPISEITDEIHRTHQVSMNREKPYQLIARAARQGWIQFNAPLEYSLQHGIKQKYPGPYDVQVVHTAASDDVACAGARALLELLRQERARASDVRDLHVGFAGGRLMRKLARRFGELLCRPCEGLPDRIVFHAMVAGFDVHEPTTDPSAFFTYFVEDPAMAVRTAFVGLHAPAVVGARQFRDLVRLKEIREAHDRIRDLDILVTSAACWMDEHSMLRKYMESSEVSMTAMKAARCVGDMLWRPIGPDGPIDVNTALRAMTIIELSDVAQLVKRGKKVLLAAGPCGICHSPKTEIVRTILSQKEPLVTHLVVDTRCARALLEPPPT